MTCKAEKSTAVIHRLRVCHSAALNTVFTHTSIGLNLAPLYFSQTYLFCTAANSESNCADSIPRTIPQPAHVHRKNQSLLKSVLIWARTSHEKTSSKSLLMQAVISLVFLPNLYIYTGLLTWIKGATYTQDKSKALRLDTSLKRMDFFKVRAVAEKFSIGLIYSFIPFSSFSVEVTIAIRLIKTNNKPYHFLFCVDMVWYFFYFFFYMWIAILLHTSWQTGNRYSGSYTIVALSVEGTWCTKAILKLDAGQSVHKSGDRENAVEFIFLKARSCP